MISIATDSGSQWQCVDMPARIVVSVDLHDSMRSRLEAAHRIDVTVRNKAAMEAYSRGFLTHNAIVYEQFKSLPKDCGAQLVDFVADGLVLTFNGDAIEAALDFGVTVVDRLSERSLDTSVGIDSGEVAIFDLIDALGQTTGFREVVGIPIDRAVRLSWLARPGQVLVASGIAQAPTLNDHFVFVPNPSAVGVTLDRWHTARGEGGEDATVGEEGEENAMKGFTVYAVYAKSCPEASRQVPKNTRKLVIYSLRLRSRMEDLLNRFLPEAWESNEKVLDHDSLRGKREAVIAMTGLLSNIRVAIGMWPPELRQHDDLDHHVRALSTWCTEQAKTLKKLDKDLSQRNVTWTDGDRKSERWVIDTSITSIVSAISKLLRTLDPPRGIQDGPNGI